MSEKEKLIKQLVAKTFKEFGCYKQFRRNFNNPKLKYYNDAHRLVLKLLNGEEKNFSMREIILNAFRWRLTSDEFFWNNLYNEISKLDHYIKSTPKYSVFDPYFKYKCLYNDSIL